MRQQDFRERVARGIDNIREDGEESGLLSMLPGGLRSFGRGARDFAGGMGSAVGELTGFAVDAATAFLFDDEDFEGFWSELTDRGGSALEHTFGPDTGFGAIAREFAWSEQVGDAFDWYMNWVVDRPFTTAVGDQVSGTAITLNAARKVLDGSLPLDEMEDWVLEERDRQGLWDPTDAPLALQLIPGAPALHEAWTAPEHQMRRAHSPGQNLTMALAGVDTSDAQEVLEFSGTWQHNVVSGTIDAALRLGLDPDVVGARNLRHLRHGIMKRPIDRSDLSRHLGPGSRWADKVNPEIDNLTTAQLWQRHLKDHEHGAELAHLLKSAGGQSERTQLMRAFMGDELALDDLIARARHPDGPKALTRSQHLMSPHSTTFSPDDARPFIDENGLQRTAETARREQRLNSAVDQHSRAVGMDPQRAKRLRQMQGVIQNESEFIARGTKGAWRDLKLRAQTSDTMQDGLLSPVTRAASWAGGRRPMNFLRLEHNSSAEQLRRQLRRSDIDAQRQDELLERFIAAENPSIKREVYEGIENEIITATYKKEAARRGISTEEAEESITHILNKAQEQRRQSWNILDKQRKYDGKGRGMLEFTDDAGELHRITTPLYLTQEANVIAMADVDRIKQATRKIGGWRLQSNTAAKFDHALESFTKIWKASHLLRPAWMTRTILLDEQLRMLSRLGTFTNYLTDPEFWKAQARGMHNFAAANAATGALGRTMRRAADIPAPVPRMTDRAMEGFLPAGVDGHWRTMAERMTNLDFDWMRLGEIPGFRWMRGGDTMRHAPGFEVSGHRIDPFVTPGDASEIHQRLMSSTASFDALLGRRETDALTGLRGAGRWQSMTPDMRGYADEWAKRVNMQIGQDEVAGRLARGWEPQHVKRWLTETEDGMAYMERMPWRKEHMDDWLEEVHDHVWDYLGQSREVADKALAGTAKYSDLRRATDGNEALMPVIHGEHLDQMLGQGPIFQMIKETVDNTMHRLGTLSSDKLLRQPFAEVRYRHEMQRRIDDALASKRAAGRPEQLSRAEIERLQERTRERVVKEVQDLFYDFADQGNFGHAMRHVMPFYGAFEEAIRRWSGLVVERPDFAARIHRVWNGADQEEGPFSMVTDEHGEDYIVVDVPKGLRESVLSSLPEEWAAALEHQEEIHFNRDHLNMIMSGPGWGAPVTIPVNEIAKGRPSVEEAVEFILPHGTQDTRDFLLPSLARRADSLRQGEEDRSYAAAMGRFWQLETTEYELGRREDPPTHEEIREKTDSFFKLRMVAGAVLPANPQFPSPYQHHIDAYRALREDDPLTADERFLDRYGEEFFALTNRATKTNLAIPTTIEAWEGREEYADLLEESPELASLILGEEGAGEFSRSVYNAQLETPVEEGSSEMIREHADFTDWEEDYQERLGWIRFDQAMSLIDDARVQQGLPNLRVADAEHLANAKRAITESLAHQYPDWWEAYNVQDRLSMERRMKGLKRIAEDDRFEGRAEIEGLRAYFTIRDAFQAELARRRDAGGAVSLEAAANQDLAHSWEEMVGMLRERNPAFDSLYNRWLDRDGLQVEV